MGRFDWAADGTFDITDISDDDFHSKFKSMTDEQKVAILDDLEEEEEDAEAKAKALAFVSRIGTMVMKGIDLLA